MMFIGNLNYVAVAVVGGLRVASGTMSLGDVQAFIQYSRQFTQPLTQVAVDGERAAVRASPRPSGCSSCWTPPEQSAGPAEPAGDRRRRAAGSSSSTCRSATSRTSR